MNQAVGLVQNAKWNLTDNWKCHTVVLGIPLLRQLSWRLFLLMIMDLKWRLVLKTYGMSILFWDIFTWKTFTFCHITRGLLENSQKLYSPNPFLPIRWPQYTPLCCSSWNSVCLGGWWVFWGTVVIPKILGYDHRGTFMLLVRAGKIVALSGNVVMHFLYKSKTCFCSGAVWCRSQHDGSWGRNMKGTVKGIRRDWWVLPFHVSNLGACSFWQ